jgi:hypothetical protein
MYNPTKPKPKIDPMNLDFDFMIKNHPKFFTKLSSQNFEHPPSPTPRRPLPASGGYSGLPSVPDDYLERGGRGQLFARAGAAGATLKPKIYPPTLIRNAKPERGRNNFFK